MLEGSGWDADILANPGAPTVPVFAKVRHEQRELADAEMHRLAKLEFVSHPDQAEVSGISLQWRYDRALKAALGKKQYATRKDEFVFKGAADLEEARDALTGAAIYGGCGSEGSPVDIP